MAIAILVVLSQPSPLEVERAGLGHLRVTAWNVSTQGPFDLDRDWRLTDATDTTRPGVELKRGEEISLAPSARSRGPHQLIARMTLDLPEEAMSHALALATGAYSAHYKLYIRGVLSYDSRSASGGWKGDPGYTSIGAVLIPAQTAAQPLQLIYVFTPEAQDRFVMETAPRLGDPDDIITARARISIAMLVLVGAMIFATAYHIVIYAATRDNPTTLIFAAFTALFGLRTLVIEPIAAYVVPSIGPELLWRLNFSLTILLGPACYWFFAYAFPRHISQTLGKALTVFCVTASVLCLTANYQIGVYCLKLFQLAALVLIVAIFRGIMEAVWARASGSRIALIGWACAALPALHDILVDSKLINGPNLMPFGFMGFFLCLSGILAARLHQAQALHRSTALELKLLNENLEARIAGRTEELSLQLEASARQSRELEAARAAAVSGSQAKSRFLANMSHELRTPLNAIIGFSEMIENRVLGDAATAKYAEYAGYIHRSGGILLQLINGILDLSKIEAGKFELRQTKCRLVDLVDAATELVSLQASKKSLAIVTKNLDDMDVIVDRAALQQVLTNLLSNAVKFTPAGGHIQIAGKIDICGELRIDVADTGIGISAKDLGRVMESFGQAQHDVTTHEERGTGLGLPIARGLIEAHGGRMAIESALGKGTTVTINLPATCVVQKASANEVA